MEGHWAHGSRKCCKKSMYTSGWLDWMLHITSGAIAVLYGSEKLLMLPPARIFDCLGYLLPKIAPAGTQPLCKYFDCLIVTSCRFPRSTVVVAAAASDVPWCATTITKWISRVCLANRYWPCDFSSNFANRCKLMLVGVPQASIDGQVCSAAAACC